MAARGRSYRGRVPVVSWPGTGRIVGSRLPCRSPRSRALRCAMLLRPAVSRAYALPCRRLPLGRVVACMAVSQAQGRAPGRPCPGLAVLYCNTAQPFLFKSVTIQFFFCIATQAFLALKPASVTIVLQYNCQPTAHLLQYKPSSYNTIFFLYNIIWAVAQKRFCTKFFFFHYS